MAVKTLDIDTLIDIFNELSQNKNEMGEQEGEAAAASTPTTGGGGAGYPSVTKWETGLTRSVANQIDYKAKWKDLNKLTRGKANTLL